MANTQGSIVILLVHGAWHGSWCWKNLIPYLDDLKYRSRTIDLPSMSGVAGKTQFDDSDCIRLAVQSLVTTGERVIVVAHSYGGPVACSAIMGLSATERATSGQSGGVLGYIALCANVYPGGMNQGVVIDSLGGLPYADWDSPSTGLWLNNNPREMFYSPDVPTELADWALTQLRPHSIAAIRGIVPPQAWQSDLEKYKGKLAYIKTSVDRTIPVASQEDMIASSGGDAIWNVRSLASCGHSPFLSEPAALAKMIKELVADFEAVK